MELKWGKIIDYPPLYSRELEKKRRKMAAMSPAGMKMRTDSNDNLSGGAQRNNRKSSSSSQGSLDNVCSHNGGLPVSQSHSGLAASSQKVNICIICYTNFLYVCLSVCMFTNMWNIYNYTKQPYQTNSIFIQFRFNFLKWDFLTWLINLNWFTVTKERKLQ